MTRFLAFTVALLGVCLATTSAKIRRDTYLTALMESQGSSGVAPGAVYGSPAMDYGAPDTSGYSYNAPAEPHTLPENPFEPLHSKLILVFKVLLKVLVFKLIVKFLAIICVLFFLPKLSGLGIAKEASDEARKLKVKDDADQLQLTQFVLGAISRTPVVCQTEDGLLCRLKRAIDQFDQHNSFPRLFGMYLKEEEEESLRHKAVSSRRR